MTERNTRVRASQIRSILPDDIESTNLPVDNYVPSYNSASGKFTWTAVAGGHDRQHSIVSELDHSDKADYIDAPLSPTILTGGIISEGTTPGTFKVTALTALLRTSASDTAPLKKITLAEQDNQDIILADTHYYIILEYNDGSPRIQISTTCGNGQTNLGIGRILREADNTIHYLNSGNRLVSGVHRLHKRASELRQQEISSGLIISDEGNKNFSISAGVIYRGINRITFSGFDTSKSSPDTFTYVYYDGDASGGGTWVYNPGQTEIDVDNYNDIATGLSSCNKYKCDWVFVHPDDGHVYIVYGQDNDTVAKINNSLVPSLPDLVDVFGVLIGRILIDGGVATFHTIEMVEDTTFTNVLVTNHNDFSNIQGGTADEHYHLTSAEHTELTQWIDNVTLGNDGKITLPNLEIDNDSDQHGIYLHQDGGLTSDRHGLFIYSDAIQNVSPLVHFHQDNANSLADVMLINNDGIGEGILIFQNGILANNKHALRVYSNENQTISPLVKFVQNSALSNKSPLEIQNEGSGKDITNGSKGFDIGSVSDAVGQAHTQNKDIRIQDNDADTKIQVEESADEDIIRFDIAETQEAQINVNGLKLKYGVAVNEFSSDGTLAGDSDLAVPTEKAVKKYVDDNVGGIQTATLGITIDAGGQEIETGYKGFIRVPYNCTITKWTLLADQSGSIKIDIWKDIYANYPPTDADSICAGDEPSISTSDKAEREPSSGWITSINAGDVIGFNVDSITDLTKVTLILEINKT